MALTQPRPAGPTSGVLLGLLGGTLAFTAWVNDQLLGIAVAGVVGGLAVCVLGAAAGWQRFAAGMLAGAVVAAAVLVAVSSRAG